MKRLINTILTLVVLFALVWAGATAGSLLPSPAILLGGSYAEAHDLAAQTAGPLTPSPVGSGFTYQGRLLSNGSPVSGSYDFTFTLYDELTGGALVSGPIAVTTTVSNGLFTVTLDFGASAFNGDARYMEIAARQSGGGSYTTLSPRQPITPAPYALFALKTKGYKGMVTVAKGGGDYSTVTAALNSITDNSSTNRYLVWVAPGVYTETVTMKQFVDIEGSGEGSTTISQVGNASVNTGTLIGASNAELRSLTVRNIGGNTHAIAIYNNGASPSLLQITLIASGSTGTNVGMRNQNSSPRMTSVTITVSGGTPSSSYGIANYTNSSPSMNNVTASVSGGSTSGYGVNNDGSSPNMVNVTLIVSGGGGSNYGIYNANTSSIIFEGSTISASGGANNYGVFSVTGGTQTVRIDNSTITASTNTIRNNSAGITTSVGATKLDGGPVSNAAGSTLTCIGSYNGNYQNSNGFTSCP